MTDKIRMGSTAEIVCQAQAMPMVTLVLPEGCMASILVCNVVQSFVSGTMAVGQFDA